MSSKYLDKLTNYTNISKNKICTAVHISYLSFKISYVFLALRPISAK